MPPKKKVEELPPPKKGQTLESTIAKAKEIAQRQEESTLKKKPKKKAPSEEEEVEEESTPATEEVVEGDVLKFKYTPQKYIPRFDKGEPMRLNFIGKTGGGKSFLLKYFLSDYIGYNFDYFVIVCGSVDETEQYTNILEPLGKPIFTTERWPEQLWPNICADFINAHESGESYLYPLIIIDDLGVKDLTNNNDFESMMCNSRHKMVSCLVLVQAPKMISQLAKGQSSVTFMGKLDTMHQKEAALKSLLAGTIELPIESTAAQENRFMKSMMYSYCKNQGDFLVLDYRGIEKKGNKDNNVVYWFRAPPMEEWKNLPEVSEKEKKRKSFKKTQD